MKSSSIILATTLLAVPTLHAQIVPDGATNTLSNVTNTFAGDVTVGTNGSFTLLILSDNALLTNSGRGVIGANPTARSNEVQLVSPSARWLMADTLFVGSNGAFSTLIVSNGARVDSGRAFFGFGTGSSNNTAVVTGAGSVWSNQLHIFVGQQGGSNRLLISDGGQVDCSNFISVGAQSIANSDNEVMVTGANSTLNIRGGGLTVGFSSSRNNLRVSQGGSVVGTGALGALSGANSNTAIVTDPGSRWLAGTNLLVGNGGAANRLVVSNGALVEVSTTTVGSGNSGSGNVVVVTGAGSVWSNHADMFIGLGGDGNQLTVSNGATVVASNLFVGFNSSSLANRVTVDGGTMHVTNAAGTSVLDVRRGTNVLNGGLVEADQLLVTNTAGRFELNGGTLSTRSTVVNNGQTLLVGNGTSATTFHLAGNGTHSFAAQLFVAANATLTGNGSISGVLVLAGDSTLAPGASIGRISLSLPPALLGTTIMEISKNGAVLTNDQIQVTGTLTCGGSLTVSNVGPTTLTAGDRFQLFPAGSYAGSFATITLPPLDPLLSWTNKLLVDGSIEVFSTVFTDSGAELTGVAGLEGLGVPGRHSSVAWGDYDNDGRLDILLTGSRSDGVSVISEIWRNTGAGFTNINAGLIGVGQSSAAWGDHDNDGRLDILLAGASMTSPLMRVWRNTGSGFTNINASLPGVHNCSVAWGDYDNDGRLDILLAGASTNDFSQTIAQVRRNTGNGFTDINAGLPGVVSCSVAWGDYDNDGRLDILLTGMTNASPLGAISQVWRNTGAGFTNINAGLPGAYESSAAWGDYDNDGRLDILLSGKKTNQVAFCDIWRNTGSGFTNINAGLGAASSSAVWGDYDNDGRLDILLSAPAQVWRNTINGFTNINAIPAESNQSSAAWGDYDNDGRLDILLSALSITRVWRNNLPVTNNLPAAPAGLSASVSGPGLTLSWNAANDSQTPAAGLTYNVRVGNSPGGADVISPMAASDGRRRLPRRGNAEHRLSAPVPLVLGQTYYWSVQAVDSAFAGSPFSTETSFTLGGVFTPPNGIPVSGDLNGDGIVNQSELAGVLANLNGNGILTEADLNLVLSNYFAASPWLYLTNVAGLGSTNVTFTLTNSLAGAFSVEYTTNFVGWYFLGPATPRYLFTDTNAPVVPQRFYRLRWP